MDKITIYINRSCEECAFYDWEDYECTISELSGFNDSDCRMDVETESGESEYKPCKFNVPYYDVEDIIKWFFETQQDNIDYSEE